MIFLCDILKINAQNYPLKVAILGNSIVGHGFAPEIGWNGNWGMAASAKEKDFVRLIEKDLKKISQSIEVKELNIADFERNYQGYNLDNANLNVIKNFNPDILVLRLGDNVEDWNMDIPDFHKYLQGLVKYIANNRSMRVVVTNSFWSSATRDYAFQSFIEKYNYRYVDLKGLYDDKSNTAQGLFADIGVAKHPSDKGMQAIKDRIWKELSREVDDLICNWVEGLQSADLEIILEYCNMKNVSARRLLGDLLCHFFNHQTHHRGQVTTLLAQEGLDVGVTDLLNWIAQC